MTPDSAELINDIAREVGRITGRDLEKTFVYLEVGRAWHEAAIFIDEGNRVQYHDADRPLDDVIQDLWEQSENEGWAGKEEDGDERWWVMLIDFKGGKFVVELKYPDHFDSQEYSLDRRDRALAERYGDKEVIYPPLEGEFRELTLDDLKHLDDE